MESASLLDVCRLSPRQRVDESPKSPRHHQHDCGRVEANSRGELDFRADLLPKAALSHLELALHNLAVQHPRLEAADRAAVQDAARRMMELMKKVPPVPPMRSSSSPSPPPYAASPPDWGANDQAAVKLRDLGSNESTPGLSPPDPAINGKPKEDASRSHNNDLTGLPVFHVPLLASPVDMPVAEETAKVPEEKVYDSSFEPWQQQLCEIFDEIDVDGSGGIRNCELRVALSLLNVTPAKSTKVLHLIDKDRDGNIDRDEWTQMVRNMTDPDVPDFITEFVDALTKNKAKNGRLYPMPDLVKYRCVVVHNSNRRICWDLLTTICLFYIGISLPFTIGFSKFMDDSTVEVLDRIEFCLDCFFMADVLLNFRTSYVSVDGSHVKDWRRIALNYMKTWFFIDFFSSVPFDMFAKQLPNMQAMKLLKVGKVAKALKFMRFGRVLKRIELGGYLDEVVTRCQPLFKLGSLVVVTTCLCHWLACFMLASGDGFVHANPAAQELWPQYMAGLYWAMTTMVTVGYGDVVPGSDSERAFATCAMILGCGFYAYLLGSITSVVSTMDANTHAYHERMGLINAWLDHHVELPTVLVRSVRKHFKQLLTEKTALSDSAILHDLSPELRVCVARFIVHDDVRYNMLFSGLPSQALSLLVPIIQTTRVEVNDRIVSHNEPGVAMFIIVDGHALVSLTQHLAWKDEGGIEHSGNPTEKEQRSPSKGSRRSKGSNDLSNDLRRDSTNQCQAIEIGDSFGEEILLGLEERYLYTVTATSKMTVHMIPVDGFTECFHSTPYLIAQMQENFLNNPGSNRDYERARCAQGDAAQKVRGPASGHLEDIKACLEEMKVMMQGEQVPVDERKFLA